MGIPWGIQYGDTKYDSVNNYLEKWKAFCASGVCRFFVFPIDNLLYEFYQNSEGQVDIKSREAPEIIAEMKALPCGDGTYDMFERISDGIEIYLPDARGYRNIDIPEFQYKRADSLGILRWINLSNLRKYSLRNVNEKWLKDGTLRLAKELRTAAKFCHKHKMMIGVSF